MDVYGCFHIFLVIIIIIYGFYLCYKSSSIWSHTISYANAGDMTFYVVSLVNFTIHWSIYLLWPTMADCTLTFSSLVLVSALWVLVYWLSFMICTPNSQLLNFSVVFLLKFMTWMVYIFLTFIGAYISSWSLFIIPGFYLCYSSCTIPHITYD